MALKIDRQIKQALSDNRLTKREAAGLVATAKSDGKVTARERDALARLAESAGDRFDSGAKATLGAFLGETARVSKPRGSSSAASQVERWYQLHQPVLEPVRYRTPGKRSEEQEMTDTLIGFGLAEPMWPELEAMGFKKREAYDARHSLKDFDSSRRTSLANGCGTEWLAPAAAVVADLSAVVDALRLGKSAKAALSRLPEAHADLIRRAERSGTPPLERALALLEMELGRFFTNSPVELVDVAPAKIQAGLEAAVLAHAELLKQGDGSTLRSFQHSDSRFHTLSTFGMLRELSVLDPERAREVGSAFAKALHSAQRRAAKE